MGANAVNDKGSTPKVRPRKTSRVAVRSILLAAGLLATGSGIFYLAVTLRGTILDMASADGGEWASLMGGGLAVWMFFLIRSGIIENAFDLVPREAPCTFEREWQCERYGPFAAEKEIVTIEQVVAATGTRKPPPEQARKVFNVGFVYFLLPGQEPDPELLREHARYRDRAVAHWRHITGGRGQLTTEVPEIRTPGAQPGFIEGTGSLGE